MYQFVGEVMYKKVMYKKVGRVVRKRTFIYKGLTVT